MCTHVYTSFTHEKKKNDQGMMKRKGCYPGQLCFSDLLALIGRAHHALPSFPDTAWLEIIPTGRPRQLEVEGAQPLYWPKD